jgi:hypothetical protein
MPDVLRGWLRITFQQFLRHQNKARRTKAALERTILNERLLDRMQFVLFGQALDSRYRSSIDKCSEVQAATHGQTIHEGRAAAAESLTTAFSRPEQTEIPP